MLPFLKSETEKFGTNYLKKNLVINVLAITLLDETDEFRRLKRNHIFDLSFL